MTISILLTILEIGLNKGYKYMSSYDIYIMI